MTFFETAHLANLAYRSGFTTDYTRTSYDAETDTRVVCCFDPRTQKLMLSFRGTFSLRNWVVNLKIGGKSGVHAGISAAIDRHEHALLKIMASFPHASILITGHSLGGALANEWGRRVWGLGYRSVTVVTFGAVRSHSKRLIQSGDMPAHRTVRVVNNNDLVARLLGVSYDHIGKELYFDRKGRWHRHLPWWLKLWDAVSGRLRNPIADGISDHSMDDYIRLCAGVPMTVEGYLEPDQKAEAVL